MRSAANIVRDMGVPKFVARAAGAFGQITDGKPGSAPLYRLIWITLGLPYIVVMALDDIRKAAAAHQAIGWVTLITFSGCFYGLVLRKSGWTDAPRGSDLVLNGIATALWLVAPPLLNTDWAGLGIYVAVLYAMTLPLRVSRLAIVATGIVAAIQLLAVGAGAEEAFLIAIQCVSLGLLTHALRRERVLVTELREAREEVRRLAAGEERLRIARDLHDLLGNSLSLIVLKSEVANRMAGRDKFDDAAREMADVRSVARRTLSEVREAVRSYRRVTLGDEMRNVRTMLETAGIRSVVLVTGPPIAEETGEVLGWILRESATNVVRHAAATWCQITIDATPDAVTLEVTDNGAGTATSFAVGNGLLGLTERTEQAGGTLWAGPAAHGGFRVAATLPVVAARPAEIGPVADPAAESAMSADLPDAQ